MLISFVNSNKEILKTLWKCLKMMSMKIINQISKALVLSAWNKSLTWNQSIGRLKHQEQSFQVL